MKIRNADKFLGALLFTILAVITASLIFLCSHVYADKCFYDINGISKKYFIDTTKFIGAEWNNKLKEATVNINKDEQVRVKYSACEHFGVSATLIIHDSKINPLAYNWKEKVKWLGSQVLNQKDLGLLLKMLEANDINKEVTKVEKGESYFLSVEGSNYMEFLVSINYSLNISKVQISWYY